MTSTNVLHVSAPSPTAATTTDDKQPATPTNLDSLRLSQQHCRDSMVFVKLPWI